MSCAKTTAIEMEEEEEGKIVYAKHLNELHRR